MATFRGKELWKDYAVHWTFTTKVMGGIPKEKNLIEAMLAARGATARELAPGEAPLDEFIEQLAEDVGADTEEVKAAKKEEEAVWVGFLSDEDGVYFGAYTIVGHLKDCATVLRGFSGVNAFKKKTADRVFVIPDRIRVGKQEPDGYWDHPVHAMTRSGPINAIKRNDYLEDIEIHFTLRVLNDGTISQELLELLMNYGSTHGFGAERGLGYGRYTFTIAESES